MRGYSCGLDRGHVPMREEVSLAPMLSSVTLEVDLKQLEELVEEINSMEIGIEIKRSDVNEIQKETSSH